MSGCPHIVGMSTCEICLEQDLQAAEARIVELEEKHRWIPVSERLPEPEEGDVLVKIEGGHLDMDCVEDVHGEKGWRFSAEPISHWMPLPEPPEQQ